MDFWPKYIYLQHWWGRAARKRSICRPRNCDVLDLNTYIRWGVSSSIFSPLRRWFPGWGPSSKQPLFQPPNFSTAIVERKREWPEKNHKKKVRNIKILGWSHPLFWCLIRLSPLKKQLFFHQTVVKTTVVFWIFHAWHKSFTPPEHTYIWVRLD